MKPEAATQKLILDWLAAKMIWHIRLNTGAMSGSHNGKRWYVKFGKPGMGDIIASPWLKSYDGPRLALLWIEVKAAKGKQSEAQRLFQEEVEREGHSYILARSLDDVIQFLEAA